MRNKKAREVRRAINRALGVRDRANRCVTCLRPLPEKHVIAFETGEKFCSDDCRDEHLGIPLVRLQA